MNPSEAAMIRSLKSEHRLPRKAERETAARLLAAGLIEEFGHRARWNQPHCAHRKDVTREHRTIGSSLAEMQRFAPGND